MNDHDPVNSPSHYTSGGIECIDAMRAAFAPSEVAAFCKLNAFKYIWRAGKKGETVEDIEKAMVYLGWTIDAVHDGEAGARDEAVEDQSGARYDSYVMRKKVSAQDEFDAGQQRVLDKQEAASVGSPNEALTESTRRTVTASPTVDRLARLAREQFGRTDAG